MRSLALIALLVFVIGTTASSLKPPPVLAQQWTTNFTILAPNAALSSTYPLISGFMALDYVNGGAFIDIGGEEVIPVYFHTHLVVSPDNQGYMTAYIYEGPLCLGFGPASLQLLQLIPFEIPSNASFAGTKMIDGQNCGGWMSTVNAGSDEIGYIIWVALKTNTIVEIDLKGVYYLDVLQINFFNTVAGPFSPSIYQAPNDANPSLNCVISPIGASLPSLAKSLLRTFF